MRSQLQQSSRAELMRVLKVLDQALEPKTFLVGESLTLADMAVATAVLLPFKYVRMLWSYRFFHMLTADSLSIFPLSEQFITEKSFPCLLPVNI